MEQVWKSAPEYYEDLQPDGQIVRNWFLRLHREFSGTISCLHSVSAFDGVLANYESKLNGGSYTAGKLQLERFHTNLSATIAELSVSMPEYHYYIYGHDKDLDTGATAHTIARTPANFYDDKTDGVSVCDWLIGILNGVEVPNIGQDLLK